MARPDRDRHGGDGGAPPLVSREGAPPRRHTLSRHVPPSRYVTLSREDTLSYEPVILGVVGLLALVGLLLTVNRRSARARAAPRHFEAKGVDRFVAQGRYEEAGRLAMIQNRWDEATELYRMAQLPGLAAAAARRGGRLTDAAELYEVAGDPENAKACREAILARTKVPSSRPSDVSIPKAPLLPSLHGISSRPGREPTDPPARGSSAPPASFSSAPPPNRSLSSTPPPGPSSSSPPLGTSSWRRASAVEVSSFPPPGAPSSQPPSAKGAYSFIPSAPASRSSRPARALSDRTRPFGTAAEIPVASLAELDALCANAKAAGGKPRNLAELLAAVDTAAPPRGIAWAPGLEERPVDVGTLSDEAVARAAHGQPIEALLDFVRDASCDLSNIEVFHRLGLAYLARGRWYEALDAFLAVDDASPAYRGADGRVEALTAWRDALGPNARIALHDGVDAPWLDVLGELHRDSDSVVYRARHSEHSDDVALHLLRPALVDDTERLRFESAAHAAASLNHPDIGSVLGHGFVGNRGFLVRAIAEGLPLARVADALSVVELVEALVVVLDALAYAHEGEVVHGDVGLHNIVVRPSGRVMLTDFAIMAALGLAAADTLPPEQRSDDGEEPRSDIFAVGVTAYRVLAGRAPFDGSDHSAPAPPIASSREDGAVPTVLDEAIQKAMAAEPSRRWPSANAFSRPLRALLDAAARREQATSSQKPPPAGE